MISLLIGFICLACMGLVGILLTPVLFVGWHLFKFVFKMMLFISIMGFAFSMLRMW